MKKHNARTVMVDTQIRPADVTDYGIISSFLEVPREVFVSEAQQSIAYAETEIVLDGRRKMIAPRAFAKLLQSVLPRKDEDVLLVGLGAGYEAAILSKLVNTVIALEEDAELLKTAEANLNSADVNNVVPVKGRFDSGYAKSAPYDLVVFNGTISEVPTAYFKQLKDGGRIIAIVENEGVFAAKLFQKYGEAIADHIEFNASAPRLIEAATESKFEFV